MCNSGTMCRWPLLLIAIVLVALLIACNGGGEAPDASPTATAEQDSENDVAATESLADYFAELEQIIQTIGDSGETLEARHPAAFIEPEDTVGYYEDFLSLYEDVVSRIRALRPPAEIAAEHERFVEIAREMRDDIVRVIDSMGTVNTPDDLEQFFAEHPDNLAFLARLEHFQNAC